MQHLNSLFRATLATTLVIQVSMAPAQSVAVLGEEGLAFDMVQRRTDGGYSASHVTNGSDIISLFDANMNCLWTKEIQTPEAVTWWPVHTAGTAEGGFFILMNSGAENILDPDPNGMNDSTDLRIDLVRLNASAVPTWSKRLHFVSPTMSFNDYRPLSLKVNDIGESVFVLQKTGGASDQLMIRVSAAGELRWMTTFLGQPYVVDAFLPDGSTDCYFTASSFSNSGPMTLGLINASGVVQWTKRFSYIPNSSMNGFHPCIGTDGKLLVAGRQNNNTFLLKVQADGSPEWFRLMTTVPPTPLGISSGLYGIEPTSFGYMLVRNAGYPARGVVQYHALDGSLVSGYSTLTTNEGVLTKSLWFELVGSVGDELTTAGHYLTHNTLFNQYIQQPCVITLPALEQGECFFGDQSFAELPVPLTDLDVEDLVITSFLPAPPVTDVTLIVVDLPTSQTSVLCSATAVAEHKSPVPTIVFEPSQALATVQGVSPGQVVSLHNVLGQELGTWRVASNTLNIPLMDVPRGMVLITVRNAHGSLLIGQKLVVGQ